jgi:hypothetical protein
MDNKSQSIEFALKKVTTEQFAIIEEGFNEKGKIRLNTSLRFAADDEKKLIAVFTSFIFDSDKKPFLIIEAGCHFSIQNSAWLEMFKPEINTLIVPKGFLTHLTILTIGTSRGILHAKTEGTCFNKYVLPTINVTLLIKEDASFNFDQVEQIKK